MEPLLSLGARTSSIEPCHLQIFSQSSEWMMTCNHQPRKNPRTRHRRQPSCARSSIWACHRQRLPHRSRPFLLPTARPPRPATPSRRALKETLIVLKYFCSYIQENACICADCRCTVHLFRAPRAVLVCEGRFDGFWVSWTSPPPKQGFDQKVI
jgi:hypothetical protein